jgi:hypothetical protein
VFLFAIALSRAAIAQIQVFSSGFSGTPETISLAPIGFGSAAGKYIIPDVANSNILVVNPIGGPPSIFLAGQGGLGGIFLPTGWGANSGKYLFAGQPINQMDILDGAGNYTPFDPLNANFTTPAIAPTAFSASGSVFITDQNQFIWTAAPSGGGVLLFKDLHSDPFFGNSAPFGLEFTPVGWTTGTQQATRGHHDRRWSADSEIGCW